MGIENCPKCNKKSLIKTPHGRIMKESFSAMIHIADEYSFDCLEKKCKYTSGIFRVNTEIGDRLSLPWYKRIF